MYTFSASLAVSLAFGRVVLICSCSKSEVTKFLRERFDERGRSTFSKRYLTATSTFYARTSSRIYGKRRHVSWRECACKASTVCVKEDHQECDDDVSENLAATFNFRTSSRRKLHSIGEFHKIEDMYPLSVLFIYGLLPCTPFQYPHPKFPPEYPNLLRMMIQLEPCIL